MDEAQAEAGAQEHPFRFKSIADSNPYLLPYRFDEAGEPVSFIVKDLDMARKSPSSATTPPTRQSSTNHRPTNSTPDRHASYASTVARQPSLLLRSFSDANWKRTSGSLACTSSGKRKSVSPLRTSLAPSAKLKPIPEQIESSHRVYKVEAIDPETGEMIVRSPLKKLFGETGLLGNVDETAPPRKTHIITQLRDHARDFMDKIPNITFSGHSELPLQPSTFPVTLSPYSQGDFYMQLELLITVECNRFITGEFQYGRISTESVKKIVESWKSRGRPQVIGFRYDLATQRDLVVLNMNTIHFTGVNAFSNVKLVSVLAAWKVLAKEMSLRTFCQPDSAVKKHLHDAEKVLELIDAASDSMMAFQEMRAKVLSDIYRDERQEREHGSGNRPGSPSKQV